ADQVLDHHLPGDVHPRGVLDCAGAPTVEAATLDGDGGERAPRVVVGDVRGGTLAAEEHVQPGRAGAEVVDVATHHTRRGGGAAVVHPTEPGHPRHPIGRRDARLGDEAVGAEVVDRAVEPVVAVPVVGAGADRDA